MELELPCWRNFLTCLMPQILGMFEQGGIFLDWAYGTLMSKETIWKESKRADKMTTELMVTGLKNF